MTAMTNNLLAIVSMLALQICCRFVLSAENSDAVFVDARVFMICAVHLVETWNS